MTAGFRKAAAAVAMVFVAACGGKATGTVDPVENGKGGGNGDVCDPEKYPCGPYGYQPGSVIDNLELPARPDANGDGNFENDPVVAVKLSQYFQDKNIQVLLMTGSAEWCQPCRMEQPELKDLYEEYKAAGGHLAVLETIIQDKAGNPSDITVADRWRNDFTLPFTVAADPAVVLSPYYDINAFPMNMVIRTSDMKIIWQGNGYDPDGVRQQIKAVLAHPNP
jgi:thiol-disulfide isomerase/thioredoxin